ncbi:MAG: hypothetical protein KAR83_00640 [Thermodesulfovibrionales bacterium]|nr:hypothetical protein [Thermodesulfovibrionales bacterium]
MSVRRMHEGGRFVSVLTTFLLVLTLFAGIFGIVWTVSGITMLEYQIGELENRKALALKERKSMEAELSSLLSMQHVRQKGLELSIPDRQRIIYVKRDFVPVRRASERN